MNTYRTAAGWSNYKDQILSMSDKTDYNVTVTAHEKESGLLNMITQDKLGKVVSLKVTGTINSYDILVIRNKMPYLHHLDLTDATIVANDFEYYEGYHTKDNIIGDNMFASLDKLVSVKLPKNATSIRSSALSWCGSLVEVVLPVKLESIGGSAFEYCPNLTNIDFPPTLKTIDQHAFQRCERLEQISLPGVESIGFRAFDGCSKLTEIRIPSTLKSIGNGAFDIQGLKRYIPIPWSQLILDKAHSQNNL